MDIREQVKEVIINNGGIAKSADFVAAGIRAADVVNLCNAGFLNRVRHGYYELAEKSAVSEEQLLATLVPKGIVCVESALFHYGYSDFAPRKMMGIESQGMILSAVDYDGSLCVTSLLRDVKPGSQVG